MAEIIIKIKDQAGKKNIGVSIDFNPEVDVNKPTPAQILACKFLETINNEMKKEINESGN